MAKDASPWQKQALNKLDASSMETTRIREPQGPLVASSLRSERYSPGPLRLSNARSFLDSTSNLYVGIKKTFQIAIPFVLARNRTESACNVAELRAISRRLVQYRFVPFRFVPCSSAAISRARSKQWLSQLHPSFQGERVWQSWLLLGLGCTSK